MDKVYTRIIWVNHPSTTTALGATNLNKMDSALNTIDDRVITLDTAKANQSTVNGVVQSITYNDATGVLTITKVNGTSTTIDTKLEKLAVNFSYNPNTQQLDITLDDGTVQHVDMSALVTQYEFLDTDTVSFSVQPDGKIKANIINGSITADKLQPNYLADIIVQANIATTQAGVATDAAEDALTYRDAAQAAKTAAELARDQAVDISNVGIASDSHLGLVKAGGVVVQPDGTMWTDSSKDKATLTGSSVQFTTADDALIALSVKCKSTQTVTVQGKQLFDKAKVGTVKYINPTTGVITTSTYNNNVSALIAVTAGQSYTISGHTFVQPNTPVGIAWYGPTGTYISGASYQNLTGNGTYTAPAGAAYVRYTCNNTDLNTSQLEAGSTATSYAAFVPNSPSLDYPAPITSTGDGGSFVAGACGKNLFNQSLAVSSLNQYAVLNKGIFAVDSGKSYTISFNTENTGITAYITNDSSPFPYQPFVCDGNKKTFTLTALKSSSGDITIIKRGTATNSTSSGLITNIQLELGTTATPYEAYKGNTVTVNSGGGDLPDGTADTIDLPNKKKTQNKTKTVFSGAAGENWSVYTGNSSVTFSKTIAFVIYNMLPAGTWWIKNKFRNTHFKMSDATVNPFDNDAECCAIDNNGHFIIRLNKVRLTSQDVAGLKSYISTNPFTLEYPLITPVTADITVTPSNYLTSYKGITNVYTTDATQPTLTAVAKSELWSNNYLINKSIGNTANLQTSSKELAGAVNELYSGKVSKGELVLSIKDFGAKGDGVTDDTNALQTARDYIAGLSKKVTLVFTAGTYKYTHSPNWAIPNITMIGLGEVIMNCTETDGIVMNFDSYNSSSPNTSPIVFCVSALNFILDGANCLVGLYNRNIAHSTFDIKVRNLKSTGVDFATRSKAFYILHGVCNVYKSPTCSINEYNFTSKPFYGIVLDDSSSNGTRVSTCNRFENSIIEGLGLAGIYIQAGDFNVFDGGTSEANANYGVSISSNSKGNSFIGMGFESNPTADFEDVGKSNSFINCYSQKLGSLYGNSSRIVGGYYQSITLGSGASDCIVDGAVYDYFNPGSGALTNSGLLSTIINTRTAAGVHYQDLISGALIPKSSYQTNMSALTVGASPYTYTNANNYPIDVLLRGGTISGLTFTRQGNPTTIPTGAVLVQLSPNDSIKVTYSAAPEMILIPR